MNKETGGRAFPVDSVVERDEKGHLHGFEISSAGMTLRDYFAAKAIQGMLSNSGMWDLVNERHAELAAEDAYQVADAMLRAREAS
ncbi:hypothetical protein JDT53_12485 [Escherichia coli]|nr:hypothetical protein [Escherichia coli]EJS6324279.1 hypothetical protein [Escherichia coli]EKM0761554.1 hypothetical protein [Escherichia coli]EKQ6353144.1 hypothetical protein [Escherichia coli]ELI4584691.1 hypothetical protein [Escherichia coli]